ncbi:MAG: hypothetical protein JSW53_00205 [Candidatus Bathyarchaeota archaeon]|nr:MAG: hypothetical protein JSW53_00205 [Candidatus Bathyarchaeota archaeon]
MTLCGFLIFFLGFVAFYTFVTAFISLLIIVLLTVGVSYMNRSPLGGLVLGVFTSSVFILGFFLMGCIWESPLNFLQYMLGFGLFEHIKWGLLSAILAIASVGLFFGTLGYVFEHISLRDSVTQLHVFRDYWSNIHLLGKSTKREYGTLDRRLSSWSFRRRRWWKSLVEKITEPQSDLVFSRRSKKDASESGRGDLFDLSSGRMVGQDLVDPLDLISKYRPFVLKATEVSSSSTGVRRIAFENLIARFLGWFMPSRLVWLVYFSLSGLLICSVYLYALTHVFFVGVEYSVVVAAITTSIPLLGFVWRWRNASRELFERRPDERILIFSVYVILALLYGFFFLAITNPPDIYIGFPFIPERWIVAWSVWTASFLTLTLFLSFGYICIHRESEVVNTYFYNDDPSKSSASQVSPFRETHDAPFWLKEDKGKKYWVLRFMYFWRYEVAKVPHSDWERVEVWVNAQTGAVKWVVSDYHYRELWYKVEGSLSKLYVDFLINFHTPIPVIEQAEVESISHVFGETNRSLMGMVTTGKASEISENLRARLEKFSKIWSDLHPREWIRRYGLSGLAAGFCSTLPWTYWRYPNGLERAEEYRERPAAQPSDQPILPSKH